MSEIIRLPSVGELVADRYRLTNEIGRGGFGVVFKALQEGINRNVAVKMLLPHAMSHDGVVERFKREAHLAGSLTHPNTVKIHDSGIHAPRPEVKPLPFIVMEYLEGETLQSYLHRRKRLRLDDTMDILQQILGSLSEAHRKGIVHRDLKPENIFLCNRHIEQRAVKVLDFGIAKAVDGDWDPQARQKLTRTGFVAGTAEYMAPEQASGDKDIKPSLDVYAVGCLAFQMLSGRVPYEGNSPMDIAIKHISDPIPRLPTPYQGKVIEQLIHKAMSKKPPQRFKNARYFGEALRRDDLLAPAGAVMTQASHEDLDSMFMAPAEAATVVDDFADDEVTATSVMDYGTVSNILSGQHSTLNRGAVVINQANSGAYAPGRHAQGPGPRSRPMPARPNALRTTPIQPTPGTGLEDEPTHNLGDAVAAFNASAPATSNGLDAPEQTSIDLEPYDYDELPETDRRQRGALIAIALIIFLLVGGVGIGLVSFNYIISDDAVAEANPVVDQQREPLNEPDKAPSEQSTALPPVKDTATAESDLQAPQDATPREEGDGEKPEAPPLTLAAQARIVSTPSNIPVYRDGKRLGATPYTLKRREEETEVALELRHRRFEIMPVTINWTEIDDGQEIANRMRKRTARSGRNKDRKTTTSTNTPRKPPSAGNTPTPTTPTAPKLLKPKDKDEGTSQSNDKNPMMWEPKSNP